MGRGVGNTQILNVGGDFNWNHPMWDEDCNHHLFTSGMLRGVEVLI